MKKTISIILAILLLVSLAPLVIGAKEKTFTNAYWKCTEGTEYYKEDMGGKTYADWELSAISDCVCTKSIKMVGKCGINTFKVWNSNSRVIPKIDLSDFPKYFVTDAEFNGLVVVGSTAPADDVISAADISLGIWRYSGKDLAGSTRLDTEVKDPFAQNIISIGHSSLTKKLDPGYPTKLKTGQGIIKLLNQKGKIQLLVYGDKVGTRIAARILQKYDEYGLKGSEVIVDGTIQKPYIIIEEPVIIEEPEEVVEVAQKVSLYYFYGDYCSHCEGMDKQLDIVYQKLGIGIKKVDVLENKGLAEKYGVEGVPTLVHIIPGKDFEKKAGRMTSEQIIDWIKSSNPDIVGYTEPETPVEIKPDTPIEPEIEPETPVETAPAGYCRYNDHIVPIGTRTEKQYCDIDSEMKWQKRGGNTAYNNYECQSNLVLNGKCVETSLIDKFVQWLKKWF